jgi:hypothetical protein
MTSSARRSLELRETHQQTSHLKPLFHTTVRVQNNTNQIITPVCQSVELGSADRLDSPKTKAMFTTSPSHNIVGHPV